MPERLCSLCHAWLCSADDAFCGACGQRCARLTLEAIPAVLHIGQIAPRLSFRLTNHSCAEAKVEAISFASWIKPLNERTGTAGPGGMLEFSATADTFSMKAPAATEILVRTSAGTASATVAAIREKPAFDVRPAQAEVWFDAPNDKRSFRVEVFPTEGAVYATGAVGGSEGLIEVDRTATEPAFISSEKPFRLRLEALGTQAPQPGKTGAATVTLNYADAHGPGRGAANFRLAVTRPPEVILVGENSRPRELFRRPGQTLTLKLANRTAQDAGRQNGTLRIEKILLGPENGSIQALTRLPVEIPPGEERAFEFRLDLRNAEAGRVQNLALQLSTNRLSLEKKRLQVPIVVQAPKPFDGVLALDFGTSGTCCAIFERDSATITSLAIDPNGATTSPTVVRYINMRTTPPEIDTGTIVKTLAAADDRVNAATISRLKQLLGEASYRIPVKPAQPDEWITREASDAAADYLGRVRDLAESGRNLIFREFVLTHPAVCSLRQYRNLRRALETAFVTDARKVEFLQEPIAALIPFIDEMSQRAAPADYTVAAFDVGGGTTDVSVVRVTHTRAADEVLEVRAQPILSWGERYGGEDLTDYLVGMIASRCRAQLVRKGDKFVLAESGVVGALTSEVRHNTTALIAWSEAFKASLSNQKNQTPPAEQVLLHLIPRDATQSSVMDTFGSEVFAGARKDLKNKFVAETRAFIARVADRLAESLYSIAEAPALDYIQTSGKTTYLSIVRTILQEKFPQTTIVEAGDPKECVVLGACLAQKLRTGKNRRLVLPAGDRFTTSSLGLMDDEKGLFVACLPAGTHIPKEGLEMPAPDRWVAGESGEVRIWENLGTENARVLAKGLLNPMIGKIGIWDPSPHTVPDGTPCRLFLKLHNFQIDVRAVSPNGEVVKFIPRETEGEG